MIPMSGALAQAGGATAAGPIVSTRLTPADGAALAATDPITIRALYQAASSPVDTAHVKLALDGVDVTAKAQVTATQAVYVPATPLAGGAHTVTLTVPDSAGASTVKTWTFSTPASGPTISTRLTPADGAALAATDPVTIRALYQAGTSPVDTAHVKLALDGADVTAKAQVTATQVVYVPGTPLAGGAHTVTLTVPDSAGASTAKTWTFSTPAVGPAISTRLTPADGAALAATDPVTIRAQYQAGTSPVDTARVKLELDGADITANAQVTATQAVYVASAPLAQGMHTVKLTVADSAGASTVKAWTFRTGAALSISGQSPTDMGLPSGTVPVISAGFSSAVSTVDPAKAKLLVDGIDVTPQAAVTAGSIRYQVPAGIADGRHRVDLHVADAAGNAADANWYFGITTISQGPSISSYSPDGTLFAAGSRPTITAQYADAGAGIDTASVRLLLNGQDVSAQAQVGPTGISYTPASPLPSGSYTVGLDVANKSSLITSTTWSFDVDVAKTYDVDIASPAGAQTVVTPKIDVQATAFANRSHVDKLMLNGADMVFVSMDDSGVSTYSGTADLIDGTNTLTVQATYADGTTKSATRQVSYNAPPKVTITSPADKAMLGRANTTSPGNLTGNVDRPVTITGRVSKKATSVRINQQAAALSSDGTEFRFENFFLHEGTNVLTAVATDEEGRLGSAAIEVSVDQTAPIVTVEAPLADAVTSNAQVDVRGMVNDAVEAFAGAPEPAVTVTVNGTTRSGQVADRYYVVANVPLQVGENTLVVTATDQFGNARTKELKISRVAVGSNRLTQLSGNLQSARSGVELPKPLAVVALNPAGEPLADVPVRFDVTRGTGSIGTVQGQAAKPDGITPARSLTVTTDAAGRAQVWFTTGKQSGVAANVIQASAEQFGEQVTFAATTERGAVYKVSADMGINQFAETGSQPLELLSVVVRDKDDNPLPNVPVVYTVEEGDAYFTDALGGVATDNGRRIVMNTDKNGLTALRPTIGNTPGLVRIKARALREASGSVDNPDDLTGNATYAIQTKEAQDGAASFAGYIYTDKGQPLPGVRVSIDRTSLASTTDDTGRFEFDSVPPGRINLFVDGRTVNPTNDPAKQQWPSLHFESYAVRGQENRLPHPVYLPPLMTATAKTVGGDQDVILTIPGLQGFQMKVKAHSVTFPDGSHEGTLIVSPVTADRLPMAPPAGGAQFGVPAWTVQPAGTRFDPAIEVTLPNSSGNPPGDNLPIVQYDHDLGQFVPMGRATVSEDGAYLVTDAGSGLTKAGWGGLCRYDPDKCGRPAQCDPEKCLTGDGNCGCKDAGNKCKDGAKTQGKWDSAPLDAILENIKTDKWAETLNSLGWLTVKVTPKVTGDISATYQDKCCTGLKCYEPPRRSFEVSGSVGLSVEVSATLGNKAVLKIQDYLSRFGIKEVGGGVVAVLRLKDVFPKLTVTGEGSATGTGKSSDCPNERSCLEGKVTIKVSAVGKIQPSVEAGLYLKIDPSLPATKTGDSGEPALNTKNLQYLIKASADFGAKIEAEGVTITGTATAGRNCNKDGTPHMTVHVGGVSYEYGGTISAAFLGIGSVSWSSKDKIQIFDGVNYDVF